MTEVDFKNADILIVEDSNTQALLLKNNLEKYQISTRIAKDGVEALEQLKISQPNLIISDIEMPRMNGYDFCRQVKADQSFKNIPIILLTNLTDALDVIKGMECGADSFLTKPCEINLLLSTIQNVTKNSKIQNNYKKEKLEFFFGGQTHKLDVNEVQITQLLLSTYSSAILKNMELEQAYQKLNKLYEELEKNNEKLKDLNLQKNQLLGMAAHDLKNPLAVVSGFSSFLLTLSNENIDFDKTHQMISRINDSSEFMLKVIDDMLDFSTIESGTLSLHLSEVDLPEMIKKDLLFFESLAQKKEVKITFNCTQTIPKVTCDQNKMAQVLNNLVSNAIKFSHPKEVVEVGLTASDKEVTISVKDSGIGMSPEAIEHLFQPFNKMKTKGTAGEKGFGLGLAIVHKIVSSHHGKIWAESVLGKGTTFFVSFPIKSADRTL